MDGAGQGTGAGATVGAAERIGTTVAGRSCVWSARHTGGRDRRNTVSSARGWGHEEDHDEATGVWRTEAINNLKEKVVLAVTGAASAAVTRTEAMNEIDRAMVNYRDTEAGPVVESRGNLRAHLDQVARSCHARQAIRP